MDKEAELKKLRQKLHDEEIAVFYSEAHGTAEEDKAHNRKLAEGIQVIREQITALENN